MIINYDHDELFIVSTSFNVYHGTIFNICYIFQMIIHTIHYFFTKYRRIY